jgi:hypothetical protein
VALQLGPLPWLTVGCSISDGVCPMYSWRCFCQDDEMRQLLMAVFICFCGLHNQNVLEQVAADDATITKKNVWRTRTEIPPVSEIHAQWLQRHGKEIEKKGPHRRGGCREILATSAECSAPTSCTMVAPSVAARPHKGHRRAAVGWFRAAVSTMGPRAVSPDSRNVTP